VAARRGSDGCGSGWGSGGSRIFIGGDFLNPTGTEGSGLTGEFYAFVNQYAGIIDIVYIALMNELLCDKTFSKLC